MTTSQTRHLRFVRPLTPRQQAAARALAQGHTQAEAAQQAGVHRTTLLRWTRTAAFQRHVAEWEAAARVHSQTVLRRRMEAVVDKMLTGLDERDFRTEPLAAVERALRSFIERLLPVLQAGAVADGAPASSTPSSPTLGQVWDQLPEAARERLRPLLEACVEHDLAQRTDQEEPPHA